MAYDGTDYYGFQRQVPEQPTVQQALERAISTVAKAPVTVTAAGRTDSGVHARGQVIAFEMAWRHDTATLRRAINATLPETVVLRALELAEPDFHPRYDARRRAYEYYLYNAPVRSPLCRRHSWYVRTPLALDRMNRAAAHLVGVHDFATFGTPPQGESTVRELFRAEWKRLPATDGPLGPGDEVGTMLVFHVEANAFLYRMVRSIVGTLHAVGAGKWSEERFLEAFAARDRTQAATTAPPQGLYLVTVTY